MIERHYHNSLDSNKLKIKECMENCPQNAVTPITGIPGATYTVTEQAMLVEIKNQFNDLVAKLQTEGLLK